jgi:hypothetical protein
MSYKDTRSKKEVFRFGIQQDLLVNDIQSVSVKPVSGEEELKWNVEEQAFTYDADFWESYNVIKATPLQERIRGDLERDSTLEQQFRGNQAPKPAKAGR